MSRSSRLLILTYHRVLPEADAFDRDDIDATQFAMHCDTYARYFNVLPLADAVDALAKGGLPPRAVVITFDDGYKDNATIALPILESRKLAATFFVATGYLNGGIMWNDIVIDALRRSELSALDLGDLDLGSPALATIEEKRAAIASVLQRLKYLPKEERDNLAREIATRARVEPPGDLMMDNEDVLALHQAGMEIGAHTRSHPILRAIEDDTAMDELRGSKADLEAIVKSEVTSFAYPNGRPGQDYDVRHARMAQEAGFRVAVTTAAGCVDSSSDLWQMGRVGVWERSKPKLALRLLREHLFGAQPEVARHKESLKVP